MRLIPWLPLSLAYFQRGGGREVLRLLPLSLAYFQQEGKPGRKGGDLLVLLIFNETR